MFINTDQPRDNQSFQTPFLKPCVCAPATHPSTTSPSHSPRARHPPAHRHLTLPRCQQPLFEGCHLLDCTAPICTSNPFPTDSDRTESKYKFKTYTFCMVFVCLWIYLVSESLRRHEQICPLKKKCCLHTRTNKNLACRLYTESLR